MILFPKNWLLTAHANTTYLAEAIKLHQCFYKCELIQILEKKMSMQMHYQSWYVQKKQYRLTWFRRYQI